MSPPNRESAEVMAPHPGEEGAQRVWDQQSVEVQAVGSLGAAAGHGDRHREVDQLERAHGTQE